MANIDFINDGEDATLDINVVDINSFDGTDVFSAKFRKSLKIPLQNNSSFTFTVFKRVVSSRHTKEMNNMPCPQGGEAEQIPKIVALSL